MNDLCATTFVFGDKYQQYLPLLVYSLKKAYPLYRVCIFIHSRLADNVRRQLDVIREVYEGISIREEYMCTLSLSGQRGKAIRWLVWDDSFREFRAVYYIDIDMLYVPEVPSLFEQHWAHCSVLGRCYSNVIRAPQLVRNRNWLELARTWKYEGPLLSVRKFLSGADYQSKCSGLHFVKTAEYFPRLLALRDHFIERVLNGAGYTDHSTGFHNEVFLRLMLEEMGMLADNTQSADLCAADLMDPRRYRELVFRPHHGIHLGAFRGDATKVSYLAADYYLEYYRYVATNILVDPVYRTIARMFEPWLASTITRVREYYDPKMA